jgi:hypothetical protein
MALIYAMVLGADSIDDCGVLRAGRTGRLLGGWIPAPSTLGTLGVAACSWTTSGIATSGTSPRGVPAVFPTRPNEPPATSRD